MVAPGETLSRYWLAGCYVPPSDGKPRRWDMRVDLSAGPDGVGVLSGVMLHTLSGEVRRFTDTTGAERSVQTFRYVQADGSSGILLLCAVCGRVAGLRSEAVDLGRMRSCDGCGAVPSRVLCRAGHAFGSCALCAGEGGGA